MSRFALVAALLLVGCAGEPMSPEQEIEALFQRFKVSASERDVGAALDLISDDYADAAGHDKNAIKGLVLRYFTGHEAIHVFHLVRGLELAAPPDAAHVRVSAALTGAPVAEVGELETLNADLFKFEFSVAREADGVWRIRSGRWSRASVIDFL
jgi:hypothetical protein